MSRGPSATITLNLTDATTTVARGLGHTSVGVTVTSELIPLALGIALSPAPVLAVGVMLLARRATAASLGFTVGWIFALASLTAIATTVSESVSPSSGVARASYPVQVAFGVALLILATRQWFTRPAAGTPAVMPKWMVAAAGFGAGRAAVLGVVLVVLNPKVVPLCLAAGREIGTGSTTVPTATVVAVFVLGAAATVIAPTCAQLVVGARVRPWLESTQDWLVAHYTPVVCVTLVVVGTLLVATGVRGF